MPAAVRVASRRTRTQAPRLPSLAHAARPPQHTLMLLPEARARLRTPYLDLLVLDSAGPSVRERNEAWFAMEQLKREGKVRALGVSNFGSHELHELSQFATVWPAVAQTKFSVYNPGEPASRPKYGKFTSGQAQRQ